MFATCPGHTALGCDMEEAPQMRSPEGRIHNRQLFWWRRYNNRHRCYCYKRGRPWCGDRSPNQRNGRHTHSTAGRSHTPARPPSTSTSRSHRTASPSLATIAHSYPSPWFSIVTRRTHCPFLNKFINHERVTFIHHCHGPAGPSSAPPLAPSCRTHMDPALLRRATLASFLQFPIVRQ